jgi:vitamin K-dependent gamma-carboxylase
VVAPLARLRAHLVQPVDGASLALFRISFGAIMTVALVRFWAKGWIEELYLTPHLHFTYFGFSWVHPPPAPWAYALFVALIAASVMVALGVYFRVALAVFVLGFSYLELWDATYYLNHYYAITCFGVLLLGCPADRAYALRPSDPLRTTVPRLAVWVLRAQLGVIYFFAGLAKVHPDWMWHAEPLASWLAVRGDAPLIGPWLGERWVAFAMSWAGMLFDLSIPFFLSWRRTRPFAYLVVVGFHVATASLFRIGMFPWVMIALTPIFFSPDWPRRFEKVFGRAAKSQATASRSTRVPRAAWGLASAWFVLQVALPLRHWAYPGDLLWTTEGMRWSWHVMIAERAGWAEFVAVDDEGRRTMVSPSRVLTPLQARTMVTEPSMILQFAHWIRDDFAKQGEHVRVFADVWVAWGGRPSRPLVHSDVDLGAEEETLAPYSWVYREDEAERVAAMAR